MLSNRQQCDLVFNKLRNLGYAIKHITFSQDQELQICISKRFGDYHHGEVMCALASLGHVVNMVDEVTQPPYVTIQSYML